MFPCVRLQSDEKVGRGRDREKNDLYFGPTAKLQALVGPHVTNGLRLNGAR